MANYNAVINRLLGQVAILERENMKRHQIQNVQERRLSELEARLAKLEADDPVPEFSLKRGFAGQFAIQDSAGNAVTDYMQADEAKRRLAQMMSDGAGI